VPTRNLQELIAYARPIRQTKLCLDRRRHAAPHWHGDVQAPDQHRHRPCALSGNNLGHGRSAGGPDRFWRCLAFRRSRLRSRAESLRAYAIAAPQRASLMPDIATAEGRAAGIRGALVVRYARAGKGAAKRHRPSGAEIKRLDRSKFVAALAPQGMQIRRLVTRRDGASDA